MMAGSYRHITEDDGSLSGPEDHRLDNLGDAYEAIEEMYGMIWWLADGDPKRVNQAHLNWDFGISEKSPTGEDR